MSVNVFVELTPVINSKELSEFKYTMNLSNKTLQNAKEFIQGLINHRYENMDASLDWDSTVKVMTPVGLKFHCQLTELVWEFNSETNQPELIEDDSIEFMVDVIGQEIK